jgi:hypothetical protein
VNEIQRPEHGSAGAAIVAFVVGGVVISVVLGLFLATRPSETSEVTADAEGSSAADTATFSATPLPGRCYNLYSPVDSLDVVTVEPRLATNPQNGVRVSVRYTLDSHPKANLTLYVAYGTGRSIVSETIEVDRGSGIAVLQQTKPLRDELAVYPAFWVHLSPQATAYRAAGYNCFSPIVTLRVTDR